MYFHFGIILMIISQCSDIIFALCKITKSIIKLSIYVSCYQNMHVSYFFINFTGKTKESQCFCLIFFNVNIEKVLFCVCHMDAHDFSTPVHILSFWDVNICKTCCGTVSNSFFTCIARLWNSVPAYCFPLSYNLHLFKGSISMHLASLTITWKPTNKNIGNFISYLKSKLINWFEKWCAIFEISHIIWSHLCLLLFSLKVFVSSLFT